MLVRIAFHLTGDRPLRGKILETVKVPTGHRLRWRMLKRRRLTPIRFNRLQAYLNGEDDGMDNLFSGAPFDEGSTELAA